METTITPPSQGSYRIFSANGGLFQMDYLGNITLIGPFDSSQINNEITEINNRLDMLDFISFSGSSNLIDLYKEIMQPGASLPPPSQRFVSTTPSTGFINSLTNYSDPVVLYSGATLGVIDDCKVTDIIFDGDILMNDGISGYKPYVQPYHHSMLVPHLLFFSGNNITSINAHSGFEMVFSPLKYTYVKNENRNGYLEQGSCIKEIRIPISWTGLTKVQLINQELSSASVENILTTLDFSGILGGVINLSGGLSSPPATPNSVVAFNNLTFKNWFVKTN